MYIVFHVRTGDKYNIDYYKNLVEDNIIDGQQNIVYMVDLSIQPYTDLQVFKNWLDELGIEFYWIDHHIAAIEATKHLKLPGLQTTKHSGCWLTWSYLNNCNAEDVPLLYNKISDFDTWNLNSSYNWQTELLPLTYYLESFGIDINDNNSYLVKLLATGLSDNKFIKQFEQSGLFIYNWVQQQYKNNTRKMYEYDWNDYHCLVVNSSFKGSKQFEVIPNYKDYDLLIAWSFNGEKFEYCMYTTKKNINCGALCKTYLNGGGHAGAAGGNSRKFVFGTFKTALN